MARIQIPVDVLTSRFNISERFNSMRAGGLATRFSNLKPISEFFDYKRVSKPENFAEAQSRVNYNLSYFSSNYAVVFTMLGIYSILSNMALLFDIILVVAGMYIIRRLDGRDLEIGSFRATTSQLYTGLLCVAIPVGLWASPITTVLWLIGASGGRPRAPNFAPQWGRPSRRGRRKNGGRESYWDPAGRVVEEVAGTDEDGDENETEDGGTQGVGLTSRRGNRRIEGGSLRYSGRDGGGRETDNTAVGRVGGYSYHSESDDDDDDDEDGSSEEDYVLEEDLKGLSPMERDEVLVQSALRHIQRAQERGRTDVRLTEEELGAMDRRRKRMEEEAARKAARRRARSQRIAVPLSQLESPRKKRIPSTQDLASLDEEHAAYPPMGYFPPPSSRPRSGTTGSQRPGSANLGSRGSSPFAYSYVQPPSRPPTRQTSDSSNLRTRASRARALAQAEAEAKEAEEDEEEEEDSDEESSSASDSNPVRMRGSVDPFKYQISEPRPTRGTAAMASGSRRNPGAVEVAYGGGVRVAPSPPSGARNLPRTRQVTPPEESSDDTSDEDSDEVIEVVRPPQRRTRNAVAAAAVVEEDRDHRREKEEKARRPPASSPVKAPTGAASTKKKKKRK
ncbi:uncharacterized protein DNG_00343 [Cephalotrichum gorgonifer]|uniref:Prenylated Rab acceptor 1 n=1 Tax=Cephalotrichum gorgonifer TaxID=2041049 RepID=A0AAE8MPT2_9PEZI|nr:uncharacterized protein DNG_00343 [Cephalotrichum gorgonifer]